MKILVPNIGSTSFKWKLLEMPGGRILAEGNDRAGLEPRQGSCQVLTIV